MLTLMQHKTFRAAHRAALAALAALAAAAAARPLDFRAAAEVEPSAAGKAREGAARLWARPEARGGEE
ncbi:MAG: hypothetical protein VXV87_06445, partial [Pseudomonadota bacterium]|nr:hypothetical protein [Pseudomonadota bacterium]